MQFQAAKFSIRETILDTDSLVRSKAAAGKIKNPIHQNRLGVAGRRVQHRAGNTADFPGCPPTEAE